MGNSEPDVLTELDRLVGTEAVAAALDAIASAVARRLAKSPGELLAWEPVPLGLYGSAMPGSIRSSWVFVLRARSVTGAERHSNSLQRMVSFRAGGDFQTMERGVWVSHRLVSDRRADLGSRWISIPKGVWHQGVVGEEDWAVVSFHTVPESELSEERPDGEDGTGVKLRRYAT